jgi:hypothetical protein
LEKIALGEKGFPMIVVRAFFDESGTSHKDAHVVFGGALTTDDCWRVLSFKWQELIGNKHIPYIHMADAMYYRGPFADWKGRERERDELLVSLVEMTVPLMEFYVSSPIPMEDYKKFPKELRYRLRDPHYSGFEICVKQTMIMLGKGRFLQIICDQSDEYSPECLKIYLKPRKNNPEFRRQCIGITFGNDEFFPPLQLADVFAYCERQECNKERFTPEPVVQRLLEIFNARGIRRGGGLYGLDSTLLNIA